MTTSDFNQTEDTRAALNLTREELSQAHDRICQLEGELVKSEKAREEAEEYIGEIRYDLLTISLKLNHLQDQRIVQLESLENPESQEGE